DNWKPRIHIDPNWDFVELKQVATVIAGQSPESKYYNNNQEGLPFFQGKTEFQDIHLGKPKVWTTQITKTSYPNDIVMSVRAPVGPVNIVTEDICIGRGLAAIRCNDRMLFKFCFYFLKHIEKDITGTSGSTFSSISKSDLEKVKVPLPDITIQLSIVECIEYEQKLVDANRELINLFEQKIKDRIDRLWK
ncbi:MAG: restriction endonuclease subunit S, partial [Candidatus Cloacimonetes bacterium]|nr:restriction endonuclease subunit S [Candidatus Cloacimonadota bacterium]